MNLVAKEFVIAQDPEDPGVLVLSRFAGAAEQLEAALIVNPHDTSGVARAIFEALNMPLEERKTRHAALLATLRRHDARWWASAFLDALSAAHAGKSGEFLWSRYGVIAPPAESVAASTRAQSA
jgi:trehalose 6-phosphate synthase